MKRPLLLLGAVALASCTGLYLENGNAYPCDFSQPANVRDVPCISGDVCSVSNVCVKYIYEGPRFEGPPKQPDYALEAASRLHPQTLTSPITLLGRDTSRRGFLLAQTAEVAVRVTERGDFFESQPIDSLLRAPVLTQAPIGPLMMATVVGIDTLTSQVSFRARPPVGPELSNSNGPRARRVRFVNGGAPYFHVAGGVEPSGVLAYPTGLTNPAFTFADGGLYAVTGASFDVAALNRLGAAPTTLALTSTGLWVRGDDGGFTLAAPNPVPTIEGELSLNAGSTLLTQVLNDNVLSTWQVGLERGSHSLQLAWPDCSPCRDGIALVTPLPQEDGLGVDVLCGAFSIKSLVRVTGSNALSPNDACITQTLPLPFDVSRVQLEGRAPMRAAVQRGAALGGTGGEVWVGETLSSMLPLTLERVPLDVSTMKTRGQSADEPTTALAALTDRYLAVLPPRTPTLQSPTGFRRIDALANLGSAEDVRFMGAVHGTDGWAVLGNGVLAAVSLDLDDAGTGDVLRFGRRLVSPSGTPVTRSAGGEAFVFTDAGLAALYVAADDGLYAIGNPESTLESASGGTGDVTPQLQPEPSVPIRSLALERTPLGTDGVSRARGYLVTSRNVYEWKLGGTPARWSSRLLALAGGEPVEVWFDQSRSALGRVGYADGQIFTLPSGFQLAQPLPAADSGVPTKVLDYENFGGWPVALTTTGLYSAGWPLGDDGGVQNRFPGGRPNRPMEWTRRELPDGGAPWERGDDTKGRLFVQQLTNNPMNNDRRFRLLLFLPEQVLELAVYERK